jgi:hypothetical protein
MSTPKYQIIRNDLIKTQTELENLLKKDGNLELLLELGYIKAIKEVKSK